MVSVLSGLVLPSGLAYALFVIGLLAAIWRRSRPWSWWLLAGGACIVLLFSSGKVAALLMSPLEYEHAAIQEPQKLPEVRHIVVLTGWAADDADLSLSDRMNASAAYRTLLALELYRDRPDCDVIVSGDEVTSRIMSQVMIKLGVPTDRLRVENQSRSTADSAKNLQPLLGEEPFFLVTSAGHLPRSLEAMQRNNLRAIPAPTDHHLPKDWTRAELRPTPHGLGVTDLAIHEYVGRLWYRLRDG